MTCTVLSAVAEKSPATNGTSLCSGPSAQWRRTESSLCSVAWGHDCGGTDKALRFIYSVRHSLLAQQTHFPSQCYHTPVVCWCRSECRCRFSHTVTSGSLRLPSAPAGGRSASKNSLTKKKNVFQCASVFEGVRTDLCQSLREAGRLSLWERQEEGLLPERSESWNITKRKEILKCNAAKSMKWTHGRHNCHVQHQKGGTESVLQVVADADDWSKQDGLLLLFLLRRLCAGLPAVPVFPVQNW